MLEIKKENKNVKEMKTISDGLVGRCVAELKLCVETSRLEEQRGQRQRLTRHGSG